MTTNGKTWLGIVELNNIPKNGSRVLEHPEGNVAIFRTEDDSVFAIKDECPHKKGPLSQGIVCGHKVACPLHNWHIHLDSGIVQEPDEGSVKTYPVKVENDTVFVQI